MTNISVLASTYCGIFILFVIIFISYKVHTFMFNKKIKTQIQKLDVGSIWKVYPTMTDDIKNPFEKYAYAIIEDIKTNEYGDIYLKISEYTKYDVKLYTTSMSIESFFKKYQTK